MDHTPSNPLRSVLIPLALLVALCGCGSGGGGTTPTPTPPNTPPPPPAILALTTFQSAATVIGQPDLLSGAANQGGMPGGNTLWLPTVAEPGLFLVDSANHRVLGFHSVPTSNDAFADFVLGQPDMVSTQLDQGMAATGGTLHFPHDALVADGKLFVVDGGNSRVLVWNTVPTTTGTPADLAIGQANLTGQLGGTAADRFVQPREVAVAGGRVIVSDQLNHRVLVFNSIPSASGASADLVLGQADFTSGMANRGLGSAAADRMSNPSGVWSDGTRLAVVDQSNSRVLLWTTFPTMNGQPADFVLGQPDLNSSAVGLGPSGMRYPTGVDSNGTQFFVADAGANRVLVWNLFPTMNGDPADVVLGQGDFNHGWGNDDDQNGVPDAGPTGRTLATDATSIHMRVRVSGTRLFVADTKNNRVLIYDGS